MTNAPEGVAVLEAAQQHLHAVTECIDYLSQVNASAALRTLAVRLQELSFRAGRVRQRSPREQYARRAAERTMQRAMKRGGAVSISRSPPFMAGPVRMATSP